jgi:hypothetical protein
MITHIIKNNPVEVFPGIIQDILVTKKYIDHEFSPNFIEMLKSYFGENGENLN